MRPVVVAVLAIVAFGALLMLNPAALAWLAWQGAAGRLGIYTQVVVVAGAVAIVISIASALVRRPAARVPPAARRGARAKGTPAAVPGARPARRAAQAAAPRRAGKRKPRRTRA